MTKQDAAAQLSEEFRQAVRIRLISDVPLGVHLSGGLDSSIITAVMAELGHQPLKTFSIGFEEKPFSELEFARAVAGMYKTEHYEFILKSSDVPDAVDHMAASFGEPFADPSALALYFLSRMTREHVTVALNGDGGDDLFAGYQRYGLDKLARIFDHIPPVLTKKAALLADSLKDKADKPVGHSFINGFKRLEQLSQVDPQASILRWSSFFTLRQRLALWRVDLMAEALFPDHQQILIDRYQELPTGSRLDRTLYTDINSYLPGDLLVKSDRMTMASSLEGRSPFLDHELAEFISCLPDNLKLKGFHGKYLLKYTFGKLLPVEVLHRRKQGFGLPIGIWFRGPLAEWTIAQLLGPDNKICDLFQVDFIAQLLQEHQSGFMDHGKRIWSLVMLNAWLRYYSSSFK